MDGQLRIQVSEDGADAERLDTLTGYLRRDLIELDVDDVTALPAGPPPAGARAIDATAIGGLMVTLGSSADGLRAVVTAMRAWLSRGSGVQRTIRLELGGDALELSEASVADQERLIGLFISRHSEPVPSDALPSDARPSDRRPSDRRPSGPPPGELAAGELPAREWPPPP